VEIECEGDEKNIEIFLKTIKKGPQYSRVDSVTIMEKPFNGIYSRFTIEHGW
jgi:acylphosphatase